MTHTLATFHTIVIIQREPINKGHSPSLETYGAFSNSIAKSYHLCNPSENSETLAPREDVAQEIQANLYKMFYVLYFSVNLLLLFIMSRLW